MEQRGTLTVVMVTNHGLSGVHHVGWVGSSIKRFVGISVNNVPPTQTIHLSGCPQVHEANMSIIKEISGK